jgi:hypothetical protein
LLVPSWSIDYYNLIFFLPKVIYTRLCNLYRICLFRMTKKWTFYFCCIHLKLGESSSTEGICTDNSNSPSFFHVMVSKLCTSRCLSCSLQADEHYNVWLVSYEFKSFVLTW